MEILESNNLLGVSSGAGAGADISDGNQTQFVIFELTLLKNRPTFNVDYKIAKQIGIINELSPDIDEFPFKVPILTSKLKYIEWICRFIEIKTDDSDKIDTAMKELSILEKCELLMDANELGIPDIEKKLAEYISKYIRSLTDDVRKDTFSKSRDLTPDEIKNLRRENEWMESDDIYERRRCKQSHIFIESPPTKKPGEKADMELFLGLKGLSFSMFALILKMI